uniref:SWIM-type domain-containing protein n=1 Tax=Trichobilharzia regenti TaxID=157069 RepID=A0AA85IQJ5_TRIRE|nr:unnamed protein product [Trichobilharzia regenti]
MKVNDSTEAYVIFEEAERYFVVDKHDCSCTCFQNKNMLLPCRHLVHTKCHLYSRLDVFRHSTRWLRYYNHTLIQSQSTTAVELDVEMLIQGIIYQMRNLKQTHPRICRSAFLYVYNYLLEAGGQLDDQASTSSASD